MEHNYVNKNTKYDRDSLNIPYLFAFSGQLYHVIFKGHDIFVSPKYVYFKRSMLVAVRARVVQHRH